MTVPNRQPFLSICIPAYNRAEVLPELLDSIFSQEFKDFEVVICEDKSKQREAIGAVARAYQVKYPERISYYQNSTNRGYDGNLQELVRRATGEYCVFMGNDDLFSIDGLGVIARNLKKHPDAGVFLRTYAAFNGDRSNVDQVFRYFPDELYVKPGADAIALFFRRSVVIPGMTLHRETCLEFETKEFDGSLLYQLHLVGNILSKRAGVYSPEVVTLYRNGGIPDFGNAAAEKGKFVPTERTPESSVHFIKSMLDIARSIEVRSGLKVWQRIFNDMANYSYPFISVQMDKGRWTFTKYAVSLAKLGFYKSSMFWAYYFALFVFGMKNCDNLIRWLKTKMGRTPRIGYSLSSSGS